MKNPLALHHPVYPTHNMHNHTLKAFLGIQGKLPTEGGDYGFVQGWKIVLNPLLGDKPLRGKRHTHRLTAQCPSCAKVISAGRTQQHICKAE